MSEHQSIESILDIKHAKEIGDFLDRLAYLVASGFAIMLGVSYYWVS